MGTTLTRSAGLTDIGLKREGNEDTLFVDESLNLYIVADGMGGHLAGEVASRTAVDLINKCYRKWKGSETPEEEIFGCPDPSLSRSGNYILSSILLANKVIYEMATEHKKYKGMGTTVAVLAVMPGLIISANAGDSPIYMIRNGQIEKISKDHNFVAEQVEMGLMTEEEAAESPMKHVLTKNLGSYEDLNPDIFEIEPAKNDRFVLCSDGLTDLVTDDEILQMVEEEQDLEVLCRNFIDMALKRGGHDNTTVVTVSLSDTGKAKPGPMKKMRALLTDISTVMQKRSKKNRR